MNQYTIPFLCMLCAFAAVILAMVFLLKRMNRSRLLATGPVAVLFLLMLFAADRLTKTYADRAFRHAATQPVIPGIIGYSHTINTGAAWGILSGSTWLLGVLTCALMAVCLYLIFLRPLHSPWMHTALMLITAGGLGNLYDRVVLGGVTDFLIFLFIQFPVFNLADCCITTGCGIAIAAMLFSRPDEPLLMALPRNEGDQDDE